MSMADFEKIVIEKVNNGYVVVTLRPCEDGRLSSLFGGTRYEEVTNIYHSLQDVANFLGNLHKQEQFRKES